MKMAFDYERDKNSRTTFRQQINEAFYDLWMKMIKVHILLLGLLLMVLVFRFYECLILAIVFEISLIFWLKSQKGIGF